MHMWKQASDVTDIAFPLYLKARIFRSFHAQFVSFELNITMDFT